MRVFLLLALLTFGLFSCNKGDEIAFVPPLDYLPAYPGSYWTYTNGQRIITANNYVEHQYLLGVTSTEMSDVKKVPVYDGKYLYEYEITQASTQFPLKKLLQEETGDAWQVNLINGQKIMRKTIATGDTLFIDQLGTAAADTFLNVIQVVEYVDSLSADNWYLKEYYAKNIGLIRTEIDNPFDTLPAIIEKEIIDYHIN